NDTLATASDLTWANLGHLDGTTDLSSPFSIDDPADVDWFKIQTVAASTADDFFQVDLDNAAGNLDLELYDSQARLLASSTGAHDLERVSLASLPAGNYYARVFGQNGATNPHYDIQFNLPGDPENYPFASRNDLPANASPTLFGGMSTAPWQVL